MEYRQLGRSGFKVSTLALGTMTFGGNYSAGLSEEIQGEAIASDRPYAADLVLIEPHLKA